MTPIRRSVCVLLAVAVLAGGSTAWAQAVFQVSSSQTTVVRTGHAEPVGAIVFSVTAGKTAVGVIEIDLRPAVLTNSTVDISGPNSEGFSASVDRAARRVQLRVPADVEPGAVVRVEGLRVSVPASGIEKLEARFFSDENFLAAGIRFRSGHCAGRRRDHHRSFDRLGLCLQFGTRARGQSRSFYLQRRV